MELPAADDDLEDRPGAGGGQHRRPQAQRHHARDRRRCSPSWPGVPAARACSTSSAATATPAARWSQHPTPQMVAITGSVRAGMEVAGSAAADLKRVHLELGGKAPVIVFDDADIEKAAEGIAEAGYFNAGQDCTAATRVLAGPGVHDDFVAALTEQAKGHPDRHARRRGRPVRPAQQRRPARPRHRHGRPAARPRRASRPAAAARATAGYFYEPTVLSGLKQDDEQIQNEIFGPVITVQKLRRRGRGAALGQRREVRPGLQRVDQGPRPAPCGCRAASTSASCGSTPTSRSSPRCRTAASSTPATARTCPCTASRTTRASSTSCPTSASLTR